MNVYKYILAYKKLETHTVDNNKQFLELVKKFINYYEITYFDYVKNV